MKYKLKIHGYGSEFAAGHIPDNIWKYIQEECDGEASIYTAKLDNEEVPDELKLAEDSGSFYDANTFYYMGCPYSDCIIEVTDCETRQTIATLDCEKLEQIVSNVSADESKPYFVWDSTEKGWWECPEDSSDAIDTDSPFDVSKLKLCVEQFSYGPDKVCVSFITSIEYDGEEYNIAQSEGDCNGYDLAFFEKSQKSSS